MDEVIDRLGAWLEGHLTTNGLGFDCVQARDIANIIGYVPTGTKED